MATSWTDMLKRGCDIAWVLRIEGIRTLLTERTIKRSDDAADVTLPSGYSGTSPALLITDGDRVGVELDRKAGVARGDAWDVLLAWNALEDSGLLDDIFARPSAKTSLATIPDSGTDTVLEYDETTIKVIDNSVFTAGQHVYLGKETIAIGAVDVDGTSLTGCTRGVAGYASQFDSQSFGNYRQVTDRPALWRGRFVELHAHLVSREGRIIDDTWLAGTYHRTIWRGYLDAPPMPDSHGMRLRALPLVRLAANDLGFEAKARIMNSLSAPELTTYANADLASMLIMTKGNGSEMLLVSIDYDDGTSKHKTVFAPTFTLPEGPHALGEWVHYLSEALETALTGANIATTVVVRLHTDGNLRVVIVEDAGITITQAHMVASPATYWLPQGILDWTVAATTSTIKTWYIPIQANAPPGGWMPVAVESGAGIQDITMPTAALGVIESGEVKELVRWDAKDETLLADHGIAFLRLVERQINGGAMVGFGTGGTISALSGHVGTAAEVIRTVLESSGTGARGAYDSLQFGQGLGIPEAWIDLDSLQSWQIDVHPMQAISVGRSSLADMVGGWLALAGKCLCQAVVDGECVLAVVDTQPVDNDTATTISTADVLLESVGTPQVVDAPNEVKIDPSGVSKSASVIVRDVPRIQSEGPRAWEMKVPSIEADPAINFGKLLIAQGDGQAVVTLTVGPWLDVQPGDLLKLTIAHPAMFDWGTGARAPTTVYGRCVGWSLHLASTKQRITILLAGGMIDTLLLAPSPTVTTKAGDTVTLAPAGATVWFAVSDSVELYTPGDDATEKETLVIQSINAGANQLTFTTTPASWVGAGTVVTHPIYTSATATQQRFMYVRADKGWGI